MNLYVYSEFVFRYRLWVRLFRLWVSFVLGRPLMARIVIFFIEYLYSGFQSATLCAAVCHDKDCAVRGFFHQVLHMCICVYSVYVHRYRSSVSPFVGVFWCVRCMCGRL